MHLCASQRFSKSCFHSSNATLTLTGVHYRLKAFTMQLSLFALCVIGLYKPKQTVGCCWTKLQLTQQKLFFVFKLQLGGKFDCAQLPLVARRLCSYDLKRREKTNIPFGWGVNKANTLRSICAASSVFFSHRVLMLFMNSLLMHSRTMLSSRRLDSLNWFCMGKKGIAKRQIDINRL